MFRSETMQYFDLILHFESAYNIMNQLGQLNCLHFIDLQESLANTSKPFVNQIKRIEQLLSKVDDILKLMKTFKKPVLKCQDYDQFLKNMQFSLQQRDKAEHTYLEEVEQFIDQQHEHISNQVAQFNQMQSNIRKNTEKKKSLETAFQSLQQSFFKQNQDQIGKQKLFAQDLEKGQGQGQVNCILGIIDKKDSQRFERILFRILKGNIFIQQADYVDDVYFNQEDDTKNTIESKKSIFIIIFYGSQEGFIFQKIKRVIESFGSTIFDLPQNQEEYDNIMKNLEHQITESLNVGKLTEQQIDQTFTGFQQYNQDEAYSKIEFYRLFLQKEKYLYAQMNCLEIKSQMYYGRIWCPVNQVEYVQQQFQLIQSKNFSDSYAELRPKDNPTELQPPTYFKTNEFTAPFQLIVNTYGVPRYKEINPGLFTIITFPFQFGMMYGDMAHGLLILMLSLYLIIFKKKIENGQSFLKDLVGIRYLILLMGFFSFYCGTMYNDMSSIPFNIFGSCYDQNKVYMDSTDVHVLKKKDCTYPYGLDPMWVIADNNIEYQNNLKMKLSVIVGVVQMCFGIVLKCLNAIYNKSMVDLFFEGLPQLIFMTFMFGYMLIMIFIKWGTKFHYGGCAPSLITQLVDLPLKMGKVSECDMPIDSINDEKITTKSIPASLWGNGDSQKSLQLVILVITVIMIPLMLIPKPCILSRRAKKQKDSYMELSENTEVLPVNSNNKFQEPLLQDVQDNKFQENQNQAINFDDKQMNNQIDQSADIKPHKEDHSDGIMIHQLIETIEFVLGSISNTASYLRLWALSLAHGQLSEVFYEKAIQSGLTKGGSIPILFIGFLVFANVSFGVIICMDAMECFLHALRLHWVEFQNKFYKGDGYAFNPFSIKDGLKSKDQQ